jgi:hypothetical protein
LRVRIFGWELRILRANERATREFLASVVYRVPEECLDDVVRVRLAKLER